MTSLRGWEWVCAMIKWSDEEKQRYMSVLFQSCVINEYVILHKQTSSGKNRLSRPNNPTSTQNFLELMENQLSSSGISSEDSHRLRFSDESRKIWTLDEKDPDRFERRIPFMPKINDIDWAKIGNSSECISNAREVSDNTKECHRGHCSFLGPGDDKKWYGTCNFKPEGKWDQQTNRLIDVCAQSGHPAFPFISVLSWGTLMRKHGRNTIHFTAGSEKQYVYNAHHSISKSVQCLRNSVELVKRLFWKHARSGVSWSEYVHFRRKWTVVTTAGSARSWFFGKKLTQDTRRRGKLLARTLKKKGSKWCFQKDNFALQAKEQDSSEQSRKKCTAQMVRMWTMDWWIFLLHAASTLYLEPILQVHGNWPCSWCQCSLSHNVHESTFRSRQHLETKPMFGWSNPEAQIGTWMSFDTENQKIFLKKLLTNVCKIKRKSIPKVKGQKHIFLFIKKFGSTCSSMNSVTDTSVKSKSRKLSVNWWTFARKGDRWRISLEIHWKFIGNS